MYKERNLMKVMFTMKGIFKKNKVSIIITSVALVSAVASAAYAIWQKKSTEKKVLNAKADTIWRLSHIHKQYTFPHPTKEDFKEMNSKSCSGIAYQINIHTYSHNDFGNLSRECAILILNGLAENMKDDETLSEYFERKGKEKNDMDTFMKVWVIVQIVTIAATVRLLIKLHKPKRKTKNGKEDKN